MAIVNVYKVVYDKGTHKHPQTTTDYVAAAANSGAVALAALIKTQNGDGKDPVVLEVNVVRTGVIS